MTYIDIAVCAVPDANKDKYKKHAQQFIDFVRAEGALECIECWGEDVHDGKLTSFPIAVQKKENETVAVSVYKWPNKDVRDKAWGKMMSENGPDLGEMPFDGKRMIFGGFNAIVSG